MANTGREAASDEWHRQTDERLEGLRRQAADLEVRANRTAGFNALESGTKVMPVGAHEGSWSLADQVAKGAGVAGHPAEVYKEQNYPSNSESLENYVRSQQNMRTQAHQSVPKALSYKDLVS